MSRTIAQVPEPMTTAPHLELGQEPQAWQTDWSAFAKEYTTQCRLAVQSRRSLGEVSQMFEGKVVEWTGVLKSAKAPASPGKMGEIAMAMDRVHIDITADASTDVEMLTLSPLGEEWAAWATVKEGSKVTFRCQIKDIVPRQFSETGWGGGGNSWVAKATDLGLETKRATFVRTLDKSP